MEVLWRNGIHCEEVLEVTHLALVPVSCPEIGEAVSVLQVVPSKTDTDRLLRVD